MPFSLKGFLKNRFGGSGDKYELSTTAEASDSVSALVVLGSRLCAVQHQQDATALLSEFFGAPFVFLGTEQCELLPEQVDEAITNEVEYLVTSSLSNEDTKSVGTVRSSMVPESPSGPSSSTAGCPQIVLFFPFIGSSQLAEVCAGLKNVSVCKLRIVGVVAFDGASTMDTVDVSLSELSGRFSDEVIRQRRTGDPDGWTQLPPLLKVRMGCNYADTYEELRLAGIAISELCIKQTSSVVVVGEGRPPKPGHQANDEEMSDEGDRGLASRSACASRLPKVKTAALHAVHTITRNLLETKGNDERYRILLSNTGRFVDVLGGSLNAMGCLFNCGFREHDSNGRKYDSLRSQCSSVMPTKAKSTAAEAWGQPSGATSADSGSGPHRLIIAHDVAVSSLRELRRTLRDIEVELRKRDEAAAAAAVATSKGKSKAK